MKVLMRKPTLVEAYALAFNFYRKGLKISSDKAGAAMGTSKQNVSSIENFNSQLTLKGLELFLNAFEISLTSFNETVVSYTDLEIIPVEQKFNKQP